ncbi:MAG: hypothetical protein JXR86_08125 [Spirochaetales bacterium]|nr:hypothetical protein [Spirochaetales bacterium]
MNSGRSSGVGISLYNFNARWYDPELGRFITEDPIKDGLNWYAYVFPSAFHHKPCISHLFAVSCEWDIPHTEVNMSAVLKEYDTKIDSKNRFTVRGAKYDYYHVMEYNDGRIEMIPRVLVDPTLISANTVKMMDKSVENLKKGKVSAPIDFSKYLEDE